MADLSQYAIGSANNGGGTDGAEFKLSGSASAGDYIYLSSDAVDATFLTYFGINATLNAEAQSTNKW